MYRYVTYVIRHKHGEGYWCNENGWCSFAEASHFTKKERDTFELPVPQKDCEWLVCLSFVEQEG